MKMNEDIVIVGGGIAGLATALGLHRLGIKSLVLESSHDLRVTGYGIISWGNAWKALDALGVGDLLRKMRPRQQELIVISTIYGEMISRISLSSDCQGERDCETRCLERKMLVTTLADELPHGSIRFSSKVVSIEESGHHSKLLHLADGSTIKTKVLIGCDGINSIVGRWLGLKEPQYVGKSSIRGHIAGIPINKELKVTQFVGDGVKFGVVPIDVTSLYWFLVYVPSRYTDHEMEKSQVKMKEFVLSMLGKGSEKVRGLVEKTELKDIICSPLKFRTPWESLFGNIVEDNVCVAGDAFHPMTPDIGQGAGSSLEDAVVLARCLGQAMKLARDHGDDEDKEHERIKMGLEEFAKKRRWRAFVLTTTSYLIGSMEVASWKLLQLLRDKVLGHHMSRMLPKMGEYDCGRLV